MNSSRAIAIYRRLLRVYPRHFRVEYRDDMVLLFAEQLRNEPASRVWSRSLIDLAITIPARHLEAHMNRPPNPTVPVVYAALSLTGVVVAIVGGSNLGIAVIGLGLAVAAGILAVASWRTTRAVTTERPANDHWWQVLLGGVGVLAATIVILNVVGEIPEGWWLATMLLLLAAITTTVTGLVLGVAHLATQRQRNVTS